MAKQTPRPWIVAPHDPIEKLEDNLWTIDGTTPGLPVRRRMSIVKLSNGELVFFNAMPVADEVLEEIRAWGKPSHLLVPHHAHMIDAHSFMDRLSVKLFGPKECRDKIARRAELAGTFEDLPRDSSFDIETLPGINLGEPVIRVTSENRTSLLFGDAVQNSPKATVPLMFRMMGFSGGPKMVPVFKLMFVTDKRALRAKLESLADLPNVSRVVPSHGEIVASDATTALKTVAAGV
jgi:hypothetical protein